MSNALPLQKHPKSKESSVNAISVNLIAHTDKSMSVAYSAQGDIDRLFIPPRTAGECKDNLWRTTCFEMFVGHTNSTTYWELNFSPSANWAAYKFTDYRQNRQNEESFAINRLQMKQTKERFDLEVGFLFGALQDFDLTTVCFGFSAVMMDHHGNISYWALRHGDGPPDFHDNTCFSYMLPLNGSA